MRKALLCALIALCLLNVCLGEQAEENEYMGIIRLISRCTLLTSFEGAPENGLAAQAVMSWRELRPDSDMDDEEVYALIFAEGGFIPAGQDIPLPEDCEIEAEEARELADGLVRVDVSVYRDEGGGMEFDCAFYAYFAPDEGGYRLKAVFFPD
jgi:hypothetical protein